MSGYSVTPKAERDGIREFYVHKGTVPVYMATSVWVSSDGKPRCASCSGQLVAMLASCSHAKAVKRFLAKSMNKPKVITARRVQPHCVRHMVFREGCLSCEKKLSHE